MVFKSLCCLPALALFVSAATLLGHERKRESASLAGIAAQYTKRTAGGIHLPIVARTSPGALARRAGTASAIGLGDVLDVAYSVLMTVGGITTPLILDTGSSDLWIVSDACTQGCEGDAPVYPQSSFRPAGVDVFLAYGDSTTGTFASGEIGKDTVELAGIELKDQYFAAINRTNTSIADVGSAGIFGLGFPFNSVIWRTVLNDQVDQDDLQRRADEDEIPIAHPRLKLGAPFPSFDFRRTPFPVLPDGLVTSSQRRQSGVTIASVLASYSTLGPFIARLVADGTLSMPMFSVTLQRDAIDVGGNRGTLSLGELPTDVPESNLTWVPVRAYTVAEGGLPSPPGANEVYPTAWEVFLDGVYFDGKKLPPSTLSSSSIKLSALVDTGNSLLRGPADLVSSILSSLGSTFPCSDVHTMAFEIGGKMFPVDPRDFITQAFVNRVDLCSANLAATDSPQEKGYQFSWSLGTPFLKGVLSAYYYGNLTFPSVDPPKMGFLSTVPTDAKQKLADAVAAANRAGKNYPAVSEPAPSGTITPILTNADKISATARANAGVARGLGAGWRLGIGWLLVTVGALGVGPVMLVL